MNAAPPALRSGRGGFVVAVLVLAVLAGCRVDATVETRVDGRSGTVTVRLALDQEAVAVLGGRVGEGAQVSDLRRAGWTIPPPRTTDAGGAVVTASKRFERPEDLTRVMDELSGPAGPLRDFRLARDRSFASVRYALTGRIVLEDAGAATGFANAGGLSRRLRDAGIDPDRVEALLAARAADGFRLRVRAELPGDERVTGVRRAGEEPAWTAAVGENVLVSVHSRTADRARPLLLVLAGVLAVAALAVALTPRREGRPSPITDCSDGTPDPRP